MGGLFVKESARIVELSKLEYMELKYRYKMKGSIHYIWIVRTKFSCFSHRYSEGT
jgi:hypothetical protein